jgi:sulfate-transporting ATPase
MGQEYVYVLQDVSRRYGKSDVLKEITLAFLPGAKIGVIGPNGSGKSTLLRIMAGLDKEYEGVATPMPGIQVGYVEQEPTLDPELDVRGNLEVGLSRVRDLLKEFDEVCEKLGEDLDPDEMEKVLDRQAKLQDQIDAADGWELDRRVEIAMDAMRLPPGDADVTKLSGGERRRVALCRAVARPAGHAAPRRAHEPPRRGVGRVAGARAQRVPRLRAGRHPRPVLPRQLRGWILEMDRGRGIPFEGQLLGLARAEAGSRSASRSRSRRSAGTPLQRELEWVRAGARGRQAKSKARLKAYDKLSEAESLEGGSDIEILIPPGPRLGDHVSSAEGVSKAYGDRLLFEDLTFDVPPRRHRRRHRPERRRQDDVAPDDHRRGDAGRRRADRSAPPWSSPTSTSPATRSPTTGRSGRRSAAATRR